ncbi:nitroreductase [Candidatus Endobugula sertula]|uniref:Nitroreductase n=1 Tax=Candidatus Endobugula sertula TaxID=62101 RepID=A0A1D2QNX6_9GAMM|nr:nitroreductase [Candidatus Endobugula sertula]
MNVSETLLARKSVRAFTSEAVTTTQIRQILNVSRCAPSGSNTQPWQVAVLMDQAKQRLQQKILSAAQAGEKPATEYRYSPEKWEEPYHSRRRACGLLLYSTLNISREDKQRQQEQWLANYRAFDAPVMMLFFIDRQLAEGSYMDYGMFLQSIMLAAQDCGLATCPQASLAEYPHIVREELGYDNSTILLCGMALGYEDKSALVNSYRTERESLETFVQFFAE